MRETSILVIEDDPGIRTLLRNILEAEQFRVIESETGAAAVSLVATERPALVTLDIQLGERNGLDIARDIRRISSVPIIMVTGRSDVIDRVAGLELGADDYITKPFHVREVVARVRAVLRRAAETPAHDVSDDVTDDAEGDCFLFDGMTADPGRLELKNRDGADCGLTSGDFRLLRVFLERPKRVLSRDQLMDLTGGHEWNPIDRTIDNQVARLRKKIERNPSDPKVIKTVRGVGYTLACDVTRVQASAPSARRA